MARATIIALVLLIIAGCTINYATRQGVISQPGDSQHGGTNVKRELNVDLSR